MVGVVWGGSGFVGMVAVAGMVAGKVARRSPLWMVLWRGAVAGAGEVARRSPLRGAVGYG